MSDTRFKSINIRQLVAKVDRKPEVYPAYTFSNGRQFMSHGEGGHGQGITASQAQTVQESSSEFNHIVNHELYEIIEG